MKLLPRSPDRDEPIEAILVDDEDEATPVPNAPEPFDAGCGGSPRS